MKIEIGNIRYQYITPTEIPMSSALSSRRVEMEKEIGKTETDAMFQILAALREQGDVPEVVREVFHTAYFKTLRQATRFGKNLDARGYKVFSIFSAGKSNVWVKFSHFGTATVEEIFSHEKGILKLVKLEGGFYDGWETSSEHLQQNREQIEQSFNSRFAHDIVVTLMKFQPSILIT
jgi:hypothetical protein